MNLFQVLLAIHITFGTLSLLLGLYIMIAKKGTKTHKKVGKYYYYSMVVASLIALPMSYMHSNYFLFLIGVFSLYMVLTGVRYLRKKSTANVHPVDWVYTVAIALFGLTFMVIGALSLFNKNTFGIVFITFGFIGLSFAYQDYKNFTGKSAVRNFFLTTHLQRMIGSYIASTTAFVVVNNQFLPGFVAWLLPTAILVPLIVKWSNKYKVEPKSSNE